MFYDGSQWQAGSGAFFDMNTNAPAAGWLDLGGRGGSPSSRTGPA